MEMKLQLRAGLSNLPTPKNDFEIVVPEEVRFTTFDVNKHISMYIPAYVYITLVLLDHTYYT